MVIFHGILTPFLVSIFLSFMTLSINSLPQNYNEKLNWGFYPRYYSNQRYHPAQYHPPEYLSDPLQNYESYGYHRPREQAGAANVHSRSRGPSKEVVPTPTTKQNQFNSSKDSANQANTEKASPRNDDMLDDQNDFVFPEHPILHPTPPPARVISYVPDINKVMSACGSNAIFCDYRGDYPSELIRKAFDRATEKYGDLLGRDEIKSNVSITTRFDVPNDGTPMCGSQEKIIEPPAAKNKDNEWKWIVNEGPFVQGVRVEMCDNPDSPCRMAENFPMGYKTECKQKFIYRKLLALKTTGEVEPDTFRLPSCCACVYRHETASRFIKRAFGVSPRRD